MRHVTSMHEHVTCVPYGIDVIRHIHHTCDMPRVRDTYVKSSRMWRVAVILRMNMSHVCHTTCRMAHMRHIHAKNKCKTPHSRRFHIYVTNAGNVARVMNVTYCINAALMPHITYVTSSIMSHSTNVTSSCGEYRVAKTHRMPYLHRSFSAKEPYK